MYRPLPDCLTIKDSEIEGLGLFAVEDIPKGTDFGHSHTIVPGQDPDRTPLGAFYNHSANPNIVKKVSTTPGLVPVKYNLVAAKDIKAGEELTCKYTFYNID